MDVWNTAWDSRVVRVSIGAGGVTRPRLLDINGAIGVAPGTPASMRSILRKTDYGTPVHCLGCGARGGAVAGEIPVALRHDPGVVYICPNCDGRFGTLPAHAVSFADRKS